MTIKEAKEYIPDFEVFRKEVCATCTEEWYCPCNCEELNKASRMDFNRILKCYARNVQCVAVDKTSENLGGIK